MRRSTCGIVRFLAIILVVVSIGCDGKQQPTASETYESAADQLTAEYGGTQVDKTAVDQVLDISKRLTLEARSEGILKLVTTLKTSLKAQRIDGAALDEIEDFTLGHPLPGIGGYADDAQDGEIATKRSALTDDNENRPHFTCPPIPSQGQQSCVQLVDAAVRAALASVDAQALNKRATTMIEQDPTVSDQPQEFKDYSIQYLSDLALKIHTFGIEMAAIRAEFTMREAGVCDQKKIDGEEIARLRGIDESVNVLRRLIGTSNRVTHVAHGITFEIKPQADDCLRVGAAGAVTEARIQSEIKAYIEEVKKSELGFCRDMSATNPTVVKAYELFEAGIKRGVKAQVATVWVGVFRNGRPFGDATEYVVANIDGCNPRDQITYTTSPLVIDLDGDGLKLSTKRVGFDLRATGQPQRVTWTGPGEGLLAMDLNGDGRITSGRELFGNRTLCDGARRCADGAAALARYDEAARGGNGDGRIDTRDKVFASLRVWVDENHDGRSQPSELQDLDDHGIRALSVKPSYSDWQLPGGKVSLTLGVETSAGARTAYDVWFDNHAAPGFSNPLF